MLGLLIAVMPDHIGAVIRHRDVATGLVMPMVFLMFLVAVNPSTSSGPVAPATSGVVLFVMVEEVFLGFFRFYLVEVCLQFFKFCLQCA